MNSKIFTNKKNKLAMTLTLAASCLGLIASQPAAQAYGYSTPNIMGGYDYYFDGLALECIKWIDSRIEHVLDSTRREYLNGLAKSRT